MRKIFVFFFVVMLANFTFAQTSISASINGLVWDDNSGQYQASTQGPLIGQYLAYHHYVLCVFDLGQLGGLVSAVSSGSVTLSVSQLDGYNGLGWIAGILSTDVSTQGYSQQINTIQAMSGTWSHEQNSITLPINMSSIHSNKILIGVKRNSNRLTVASCSGSITATIRLSTSLNVSYNQGSGNIVAYLNSAYATPSAPAHLTGYENDQVHIAPLSPTIPSYSLVYNESQAPLNKSEWQIKNASGIFTQQTLIPASNTFSLLHSENNYTYEAQMKRLCNVTFQNSFGGGTITAGGSSGNSPQVRQVVEGNTITATAQQLFVNYNSSGLDYHFSSWNDGSTNYTRNFTINNHNQYTVSYIRKANISHSFSWNFDNIAVGNNICLSWGEHPNSNVTQYKIWRKGKFDSGMFIGTVNRGTTSFTDYEYQYASESNPNKETLFYEVYVYCPLDGGNWSPGGMKSVTGTERLMKENPEELTNNSLPTVYKIDNYPNPFNPSTTISYQIPSTGFVTLKVYDILGKEVADLVNEKKPAGYYNISFNAGNLPSGIYIYTIQTNGFAQSKKMLFLK